MAQNVALLQFQSGQYLHDWVIEGQVALYRLAEAQIECQKREIQFLRRWLMQEKEKTASLSKIIEELRGVVQSLEEKISAFEPKPELRRPASPNGGKASPLTFPRGAL